MIQVKIYTDGAARGNPGPGGLGVVMISGNYRKELSEGYRLTTNNRMELLALIRGLQQLKRTDLDLHLFTDSKYVHDAIVENWLKNWQRTGFKGKKNADLWRLAIPLLQKYKPKMHWVRGHAGNIENERCDQLATAAADGALLRIDEGYEISQAQKNLLD